MLEGPDWPLVFALRIAAMLLRSSAKLKLPPLRVSGDVAPASRSNCRRPGWTGIRCGRRWTEEVHNKLILRVKIGQFEDKFTRLARTMLEYKL